MSAQPYGPNTPAVEALLAQVRAMTPGQVEKAAAAWGAAWSAARGAALALIPTRHFDALVAPLRAAGLTITQEDQ